MENWRGNADKCCSTCGGNWIPSGIPGVLMCDSCRRLNDLNAQMDAWRQKKYQVVNHYRQDGAYDQAMEQLNELVREGNADHYTYWLLALCAYGVEYVEEEEGGRKLPTFNRVPENSIYNDENYKKALELARQEAPQQCVIYESEAKKINEIHAKYRYYQEHEPAYDIFISFKDTDAKGGRTKDSEMAEQIYHMLTQAGYRVFYSRITLQGRAGEDFEALIYTALRSSKAMLLVACSMENANSLWVRNEWRRYLWMIRSDPKRVLIPVYAGMRPEDFPQEIADRHLQAHNMEQENALDALLSAIKRLIEKELPAWQINGFQELRNGDFYNADLRFSRVLDKECSSIAYIGHLLASQRIQTEGIHGLIQLPKPLKEYSEFNTALEYADTEMRIKLRDFQVQQATRLRNDANKKVENAEKEVLTHSQHIQYVTRKRWGIILGGGAAALAVPSGALVIWMKLIEEHLSHVQSSFIGGLLLLASYPGFIFLCYLAAKKIDKKIKEMKTEIKIWKKDLEQKQAEKKTADKQLAIRQKELDWTIETRNKLCGTANPTTL